MSVLFKSSRYVVNHLRVCHIVKLNFLNSTTSFLLRFHSFDVMKVLNVAEKNDAAKNIAGCLSRGTSKRREGISPYNKIYEFNVQLWNQNCTMIMTSVSGHLLTDEFTGAYRKWQGCHPLSLFDAPISKQCIDESSIKIKKTLEREVQKCNSLIIWTDCDREGENIGFEIIQVCQAVKPNIRIYRAKFSEITQTSINRALQNLCDPHKPTSDAVEVRRELDLRIGAAFTRFQTMRLQKVFPRSLADMLISYGSCQFPTLGFVVERFLAIERFKPEPYWKIKVVDIRNDMPVEFRWARVRLFEKLPCEVLLDICLEHPDATVLKVTSKPKSKWRPLPLDTIQMEKQGSRILHLSAKETMKIAEKLYTQGLISYPRTETNIFPKEIDLASLARQQIDHPAWGNFAQRLIAEGVNPRQGNKSDQAHPPIHPIKYANNLQGNEAKIYEFVVRHFLACLSNNAVGQETIVEIDIAGEKFTANGLQIIAKNYLEVYIYEKWSDKEIHNYQQGQVFRPTNIDMIQEETSPPQLLTEADLISLMDKYGIGTDATHAEHIDTIKSRQYVGLMDGKHLMPGKLGIGLVMGYDNMGFQMSKPLLRAGLEKDLKLISDGVKNPKDVLQSQINKYRELFKIALEQANLIDTALATYIEEQPNETEEMQFNIPPVEVVILKCPKCGGDMTLRDKKQGGGKYIGCMGFPTCTNAIWLPQAVENVEVLNDVCSDCSGNKRKLRFKLNRNAFPIWGTSYETCIGGCDPMFNEAMNIKKETVRNTVILNDTGYDSMSSSIRSSTASNATQSRHNRTDQVGARRTNASQSNASIGPVRNSNSNNTNEYRPRNPYTNIRPNNTRNDETRISQVEQGKTWGAIDNDAVIMCTCHENAIQLTVKKEGPNRGRLFYKCAKRQGTGCDFFLWAPDNAIPAQTNEIRNQSSYNTNNDWGSSSDTNNDWGSSSNTNNDWGSSSNTNNDWGSSSNTNNGWRRQNNNVEMRNWGNTSASTTTNNFMCHCNLSAKQRTVQKEGPNKGRTFYSCSKNMQDSCKFFQWGDENTDQNETFYDRNTERLRGRGRGPGRGRGRDSGASKTRVGSGGKRKCGVCGEEGHTRKTCVVNVMD